MNAVVKESPNKSRKSREGDRAEDMFGAGNELFVELMMAHDKLACGHCDEIGDRRSWNGAQSNARDLPIPESFLLPEEAAVRSGRVMQFYCIDDHPFLMIRVEGDDHRGAAFTLHAIANRRYSAPVDFTIPTDGGQAYVDLAELNECLGAALFNDLHIDFDGVISDPLLVTPDRFLNSCNISGGLSGISTDGVLRGWVASKCKSSADLPVELLIDSEHRACFFAAEPYCDNVRLKQFSIKIPTQFSDDKFHRLDLSVVGAKKCFQGTPVYFCFTKTHSVILSDLRLTDNRFFVSAALAGTLELFQQSSLIDQARTKDVIRLLRNPYSYVLSAMRKVLSKLKLPQIIAPQIPGVTIDQVAGIWSDGDAKKKRKVITHPGAGGGKQKRLSSFALHYRVNKLGAIVAKGVADEPSSPNDGFTLGLDGLSFAIEGDLADYTLEFLARNGGVIASLPLGRIKALSEGPDVRGR